jgi:predicted molibdopterin-dependent oxidoreductase YjgC
MAEINLTIDSQRIKARPGETVLEAALRHDIYIPSLCHHPDLEPLGGCRLCIVEIEGMRGMPTACTTGVAEGMVVKTSTPEVNKVRLSTLELILADHPTDCLTCVKNQDCELQKVASYLGIKERRLPPTATEKAIDDSNPFFTLDRNYCILCQRCTRTCDEITCVNAIEVINRGSDSRISTFGDWPLMESICQSCGECVVRCPVGALTPKGYQVPQREVLTTCPYCGVGCSMYLGIRNGRIVSVRGNRDSPSNSGRLCVKGRFSIPDFVHSPRRLTKPLIKKNGKFVEAGWEEALDLVTDKLSAYSGDNVAVMASARTANEEIYLTQKFARAVLKTNNIDHCARI